MLQPAACLAALIQQSLMRGLVSNCDLYVCQGKLSGNSDDHLFGGNVAADCRFPRNDGAHGCTVHICVLRAHNHLY